MRRRSFLIALAAVALPIHAARAMEPDAVAVRCSVKFILSSGGALPEGRWRTESEVRDTFEKANLALERSGANWKPPTSSSARGTARIRE